MSVSGMGPGASARTDVRSDRAGPALRGGGAGVPVPGDTAAILVVEDDPDIGGFLQRGFRAEGFTVELVESADAALALALRQAFDAVILDVMLQGSSGLDLCRSLRQLGVTSPILMLSARTAVPDRVEGLAAGADDYIAKPFDFDELLVRLAVQQVRRRDDDTGRLIVGDVVLELGTRTVVQGEHRATLTEREAELLALLMRNAGKPLTRSQIFETMWAGQGGAAVNVVDVYIGYLRRKLSPSGGSGETPIRTIRGRGFLFAAD
jgi:DNA-binding response OmpR family regulator